VARDDSAVLANAAHVLAYFGEDISAMLALIDRALALNPNYARGWHVSGVLRVWAGLPDVAIEHAGAALRLSPRARVGTSFLVIGAAHAFCRRFDQAVRTLLLAIQDDPDFPMPYRVLAACYAQTGRLNDAREIVERLRAISPIVVPNLDYIRNPEHRKLLEDGLRWAAGEGT
jgi:tetratricopeptide (TPR) repeat protein